MTVLLDTHIWLWWLLGSEKLSLAEVHALDRSAGRGSVFLSAMSLWEAQMLEAKGRLQLDRPFTSWLPAAAAEGVVQLLPLTVEVVVALHGLPESFHGDPADRLIVATALAHGLKLASHDKAIRASGVVPIWKAGS